MHVHVLHHYLLLALAAVPIQGIDQSRGCARELGGLSQVLVPTLEGLLADHGPPVTFHGRAMRRNGLRRDHAFDFVFSPSYSPKIAAGFCASGVARRSRRRLMTRRLGLILLGWKFRRGVGCGDGAALAMALRRRAVRRVRGRQRGPDKRWARRHGCEPRLPPRARRS